MIKYMAQLCLTKNLAKWLSPHPGNFDTMKSQLKHKRMKKELQTLQNPQYMTTKHKTIQEHD